jgi:hypothetical protein
MNRSLFRAALAAAALSLAACTGGDRPASDAGARADSTVPAGTRPAPGPQTDAAPHLDTAGLPQIPPERPEPITGRDTVHHMGAGQTYASCMARARGARPEEQPLIESSCKQLPDAPK